MTDNRATYACEKPARPRQRAPILIVSNSGAVRAGLHDFLALFNHLDVVGHADSVREMLEIVPVQIPALIVVDACRWCEEDIDLIQRVKSHWPNIRCLILANYPEHQAMARAAGADEILLWGFSFDTFEAVINRLVAASPCHSPTSD